MSTISLRLLFLLSISTYYPTIEALHLRIRTDLGEKSDGGGGGGGMLLWCVAKNNAEDPALQSALDWACGPGGADCGPIQHGGVCFEPEDIQSHASFAFNDYFRRRGSASSDCDFAGSAALTSLDPSRGDCRFPSSSYAGNNSFIGSATSAGLVPNGTDLSSVAPLLPSKSTLHLVIFYVLLVVDSALS